MAFDLAVLKQKMAASNLDAFTAAGYRDEADFQRQMREVIVPMLKKVGRGNDYFMATAGAVSAMHANNVEPINLLLTGSSGLRTVHKDEYAAVWEMFAAAAKAYGLRRGLCSADDPEAYFKTVIVNGVQDVEGERDKRDRFTRKALAAGVRVVPLHFLDNVAGDQTLADPGKTVTRRMDELDQVLKSIEASGRDVSRERARTVLWIRGRPWHPDEVRSEVVRGVGGEDGLRAFRKTAKDERARLRLKWPLNAS